MTLSLLATIPSKPINSYNLWVVCVSEGIIAFLKYASSAHYLIKDGIRNIAVFLALMPDKMNEVLAQC